MVVEFHTGMRVGIKWLPEIPAWVAGQRGTLGDGPIMDQTNFPGNFRLRRNPFDPIFNSTGATLWIVYLDKGHVTAAPEEHIIPLDDDGDVIADEKEKGNAD